MLIANPIYDVVFKRLMENEKVAKFFIGTFLDAKVEELSLRPQEFTYDKATKGPHPAVAVFRLDFLAEVRTENGGRQKVLIEIQKAGKEVDLMRFRNYLGEQYKKADGGEGGKEALPIKTIYILGFDLPTIETPCLRVERRYVDMLTGAEVVKRSRFVEQLTHDSFVVQVGRIGGRRQTRLEQLLSLFEQSRFVDDHKVLKDYSGGPEEAEEIRLMAEILQHAGADPVSRKAMEVEREAWRTINAMFDKRERELTEALAKKEEELAQERLEKEKKEEELTKVLRELEELKKKSRGQ